MGRMRREFDEALASLALVTVHANAHQSDGSTRKMFRCVNVHPVSPPLKKPYISLSGVAQRWR